MNQARLLGGSWVVISRVISTPSKVITIETLLITLLISTQTSGPSSAICCHFSQLVG